MPFDPSFWRRIPPALFPATLGMVGLALAWRQAGRVFEAPLASLAGDLMFTLTTVVFAVVFIAYLAKLAARPSVIFEDLAPLPGRAAVSAGSMSLMMVAAGLAAPAPGLATALWSAGLALHFVGMCAVAWRIYRSPPAERAVSPVLFLPFVGYVVAPVGGVPLGFAALSDALYLYTLAAAPVIAALSLPRYLKGPTPPPARAAAMIYLAPSSVAANAAAVLGYDALTTGFISVSIVLAVVFAARARWLTAGGFSAAWGAFTFPSAACAGAMLLAAERWGGAWDAAALLALAAATVIAPPIWALLHRDWLRGRLGPATGVGVA